MKIIIVVLILLMYSTAWSTSGPDLPNCPACDIIQSHSLPKNTIWWNPDQSGVGINIDIQGDRVFGIYYGYDSQGQSTWYTFVGDLIASTDAQSAWEVNAQLQTFENGSCINCQHQFPQATDFIANIHITFNQANHASYRIDDGEEQNIVPFLFGNTAVADFLERTEIEIPLLDGNWVFAELNPPVHQYNPIRTSSLTLLSKNVREYDNGTMGLSISGVYSDLIYGGVVSCRTFIDSEQNIAGPICALFGSINDDGTSDGYLLNIGDIGTHKMIGRKANGDTIEAYKLEYQND